MRIFQVDAFTNTRFAGNPATVFIDADEQRAPEFAALAREFGHAESAFVLEADAPDHDFRVRFFNARKEAPFVGHATIAANAVLLSLRLRGPGTARQKSGTGIIDVQARDAAGPGAAPYIEFRQSAPALDPALAPAQVLRLADALGLPQQALSQDQPARIARKGGSRLLLPIRHRPALDALAPRSDRLLEIGTDFGADGFFVFFHARGEHATFARMFCPALGIPEDPVSGNAHAMLAAYLWECGRLDASHPAFVGHQGAQVGRPGEVGVRLEIEAGRMSAAHIGGSAVIISAGQIT